MIEQDGAVAGLVQYTEEEDPLYRHASIDVFLAERFQGRGLGTEAVRLDGLLIDLLRDELV